MTALAHERPAALSSPGRRIGNVMRMHVANPWPAVLLPWLILFAIHAMMLAIWAIISHYAGPDLDADAFRYSGGISWIVFYLMSIAIQATNATFRFALGFSATRRDYYLGTLAFFLITAAMFSTGIGVLALVERATDGWGMGGSLYAPAYLYDRSFGEIVFHFFTLIALFAVIGLLIGAMYVRWRATGLYAFFGALSLVLLGLTWWLLDAGWGPVGRFFTETPLVGILAWTLPVTVVLAVLGWVALRRAPARG
ncbi:hypothetical protein [Demequina pelophila]|uniref:hypothetical protein n=1 Tax=Demequina pelophila TaxID=1638984 RepID=UPI000780A00D|nr:hypothetical protein [Demequina pelophila]